MHSAKPEEELRYAPRLQCLGYRGGGGGSSSKLTALSQSSSTGVGSPSRFESAPGPPSQRSTPSPPTMKSWPFPPKRTSSPASPPHCRWPRRRRSGRCPRLRPRGPRCSDRGLPRSERNGGRRIPVATFPSGAGSRRIPRGRETVDDRVIPLAAVDRVVAGAADDSIVTGTTNDRFGEPAVIDDRVVTPLRLNRGELGMEEISGSIHRAGELEPVVTRSQGPVAVRRKRRGKESTSGNRSAPRTAAALIINSSDPVLPGTGRTRGPADRLQRSDPYHRRRR